MAINSVTNAITHILIPKSEAVATKVLQQGASVADDFVRVATHEINPEALGSRLTQMATSEKPLFMQIKKHGDDFVLLLTEGPKNLLGRFMDTLKGLWNGFIGIFGFGAKEGGESLVTAAASKADEVGTAIVNAGTGKADEVGTAIVNAGTGKADEVGTAIVNAGTGKADEVATAAVNIARTQITKEALESAVTTAGITDDATKTLMGQIFGKRHNTTAMEVKDIRQAVVPAYAKQQGKGVKELNLSPRAKDGKAVNQLVAQAKAVAQELNIYAGPDKPLMKQVQSTLFPGSTVITDAAQQAKIGQITAALSKATPEAPLTDDAIRQMAIEVQTAARQAKNARIKAINPNAPTNAAPIQAFIDEVTKVAQALNLYKAPQAAVA